MQQFLLLLYITLKILTQSLTIIFHLKVKIPFPFYRIPLSLDVFLGLIKILPKIVKLGNIILKGLSNKFHCKIYFQTKWLNVISHIQIMLFHVNLLSTITLRILVLILFILTIFRFSLLIRVVLIILIIDIFIWDKLRAIF